MGPTSYLPGKGYTKYPLSIAHNTTLFSLPISVSFTTHHLRSYFLLLQVLSLTLCFFVFLFLMGSEKKKKKLKEYCGFWVFCLLLPFHVCVLDLHFSFLSFFLIRHPTDPERLSFLYFSQNPKAEDLGSKFHLCSLFCHLLILFC